MSKFFEILVAVPVAGASLWIIYFCMRPLFQYLPHTNIPGPRNLRLKKCQKHIAKADELMNDGKFVEAMQEVKKSLVLDVLKSEESIFRIREHHQNLLSRCVVIGEQLGSRLENLPKVEHLVTQRSELMLLLIKAEQSFRNFLSKRKDAPDWSKKDYQNKVSQVKEELAKNKSDLAKELDAMLKSVKSSDSESSVTYH